MARSILATYLWPEQCRAAFNRHSPPRVDATRRVRMSGDQLGKWHDHVQEVEHEPTVICAPFDLFSCLSPSSCPSPLRRMAENKRPTFSDQNIDTSRDTGNRSEKRVDLASLVSRKAKSSKLRLSPVPMAMRPQNRNIEEEDMRRESVVDTQRVQLISPPPEETLRRNSVGAWFAFLHRFLWTLSHPCRGSVVNLLRHWLHLRLLQDLLRAQRRSESAPSERRRRHRHCRSISRVPPTMQRQSKLNNPSRPPRIPSLASRAGTREALPLRWSRRREAPSTQLRQTPDATPIPPLPSPNG